MRLEFAASTLAYVGSSAYWLIAALILSPESYGLMMALQAMLLLGASLLTFRTHDLFFFLVNRHGLSHRYAFEAGFKLELALAALGAPLSAALLFSAPAFGYPNIALLEILGICILLNSTPLQGASVALLRIQNRDSFVAYCDVLTTVAWLISIIAIVACDNLSLITILFMGIASASIRSFAISSFAIVIARSIPHNTESRLVMPERVVLRKFLLGGQITNCLKNGSLSVETILLGFFGGMEAVAVFRVARSFLGFTNTLLNVSYQKGFASLARAVSAAEKLAMLRGMRNKAIIVCLWSLPLVIIAAHLFIELKDDQAYDQLLFVVALAFLSFLPVALQQSDFAMLVLGGKISIVNLAFVAGLIFLVLSSFWLNHHLTIMIFNLLIAMGATLRWVIMNAHVRKMV